MVSPGQSISKYSIFIVHRILSVLLTGRTSSIYDAVLKNVNRMEYVRIDY